MGIKSLKFVRECGAFFLAGEDKEAFENALNTKIDNVQKENAKVAEEKSAKKAAKAAAKAEERAKKEKERAIDEAIMQDEIKRQKEAAESTTLLDIAKKNGIKVPEVEEDDVEETSVGKIVNNLVNKFNRSNEEHYIKADITSLLDERLIRYNQSPTGKQLLQRNLETSPLYIEDGKDKLHVNKISEVPSDDKDLALLVLETGSKKFLLEFHVSRIF